MLLNMFFKNISSRRLMLLIVDFLRLFLQGPQGPYTWIFNEHFFKDLEAKA